MILSNLITHHYGSMCPIQYLLLSEKCCLERKKTVNLDGSALLIMFGGYFNI